MTFGSAHVHQRTECFSAPADAAARASENCSAVGKAKPAVPRGHPVSRPAATAEAMASGATVPGSVCRPNGRQVRGEHLGDVVGHFHAGILRRDARYFEDRGAVAPRGQGFGVPERLLEQHDELDVGSRGRSITSASSSIDRVVAGCGRR